MKPICFPWLKPLNVRSGCLSDSLDHQPGELDSLWEQPSFFLLRSQTSLGLSRKTGADLFFPSHCSLGGLFTSTSTLTTPEGRMPLSFLVSAQGSWFGQQSTPIAHYLRDSVPFLALPGYWKRPLSSFSWKVAKWQPMLNEAYHYALFNPNGVWNNFDLVANI